MRGKKAKLINLIALMSFTMRKQHGDKSVEHAMMFFPHKDSRIHTYNRWRRLLKKKYRYTDIALLNGLLKKLGA